MDSDSSPTAISSAELTNQESIDICFYNYDKIPPISSFQFLKNLCIIAQDITTIKGLDAAIHLEKLWICETRISKINGLESCTSLKNLYLYGNKISKLEGLASLKHLQVLWVSNNNITKIENLDSLQQLKDFQAGNNNISQIGNAFNKNLNLESILLSGNQFSSFREILHLARLPRLTTLIMSDPCFSDNPIASLCNYQTHVIMHLPKLKTLDSMEITEDSRKIIGATVLKKRMYYNMRIRTIKRNENFLFSLLKTQLEELEKEVEEEIKILWSLIKRIQRRRDDNHLQSNPFYKGSRLAAIPEQIKTDVTVLMNKKISLMKKIADHRLRLFHQIQNQADLAVRKLLIELETGGNVRFETEDLSSAWPIHAKEIVSKLILRGTRSQKSVKTHVNRISKIHNRYLNSIYEGKQENAPASEKNQFVYLVFQGASEDDDLFDIIENGFVKYSENKVLLLNYFDNSRNANHTDGIDVRQAVVVKAMIGAVQKVPNLETLINFDIQKFSSSLSGLYADLKTPSDQNRCEYIEDDPRQVFFSFDYTRLLPEFFIEYTVEHDNQVLCEISQKTSNEPLIMSTLFCSHMTHPDIPGTLRKFSLPKPLAKTESEVAENILRNDLIKIFKKHEIKIKDFISLDNLMEILLQNNAIDIDYLNLSFSKCIDENVASTHPTSLIKSTTPFALNKLLNEFLPFINLKTINLSHLQIGGDGDYKDTLISESLTHFVHVETLDLSFNSFKSITVELTGLSKLKCLDISCNMIENYEDLKSLSSFERLEQLDLRFNPVCSFKEYRKYMTSTFVFLKKLDDINIKESAVNTDPEAKFRQLIQDRSSYQPYIFRPLSVRTHMGYGSATSLHEYWDDHHNYLVSYGSEDNFSLSHNISEQIIFEAITTLELDSCTLFDISFLPASLVNLRWASFRNNSIRNIDPLQKFTSLEELCLEGNELTQVDNLSTLPHLSRLDLSNNRITNIHSIISFQSLVFLSLEGNRIKSLRSFAKSKILMEIYIGNNQIKDLYNVIPLKESPRLIILDLTGNAVCSKNQYKPFVVFHLPRLKILDGSTITTKEQVAAKEIFHGKLTIELLGEKVGHFIFRNIVELDLRSCKIKEIDCFKPICSKPLQNQQHPSGEFNNLKKLNLDHNLLTSIDSLASIRSLRYLSLNHNRIERLLLADINKNPIEEISQPSQQLLPFLEEIHLGNNLISKISDLKLYRMPYLKFINLQGNKIAKIDGFEHMTNLVGIILDKNFIRSADPPSFISLINLRELHLKDNRIKSLTNFDSLPNLYRILLQNNRIQDMSEIEKLKLPSLQEISLFGNAISKRLMYRGTIIVKCQNVHTIDGHFVTEEEKIRAEVIYNEHSLYRDDMTVHMSSIQKIAPQAAPLNVNLGLKLPVKITSVVLDGLEMKLSSNGFGKKY